MAGEAKFTPGDWFVDHEEADYTVSTDHGQEICRVRTSGDFPCIEEGTEADVDAEALASAYLIAAAPDLYTQLETAIEHIEHMAKWIGNRNAGYSFEGLGEDIPAMRDALAKARGER